ncbi:hypothetical protein CPB86DRAFT_829967 [Serendipita vermifera]|nr:hypothetical protein CPB86DRAFT_829967 [Serendipita vermifera]
MEHPPEPLTVPLNFGARTNYSFFPPTELPLEFTDPKLFAEFYAYGGRDSYSYGSLTATTTSDCFYCLPSTTTTTTPTVTEDIAPNPTAYQNSRVGGGYRDYIYGSSRWGSGILLPSKEIPGNASWTPPVFPPQSPWPKPYGFWPIYWGDNVPNYYVESSVYKSSRFRPGGAQNIIIASLDDRKTNRPYWYIIADAYTIEGLDTILALPVDDGGCGMYNRNPIYTFDPVQVSFNGTGILLPADGLSSSRENFTLAAESAIQYYRGSSIVLGTPGYVNAYALDHNQNTDYWGTTPWNMTDLFPTFFDTSDPVNTGINMTDRYATELSFLHCLNSTIAAAIPIIDPSYKEGSTYDFASAYKPIWMWSVIGTVIGFVVVIVGICAARRFSPQWQRQKVYVARHGGSERIVPHNGDSVQNSSMELINVPNLSYPPATSHALLPLYGNQSATSFSSFRK